MAGLSPPLPSLASRPRINGTLGRLAGFIVIVEYKAMNNR